VPVTTEQIVLEDGRFTLRRHAVPPMRFYRLRAL
jgi:hypothetical protein